MKYSIVLLGIIFGLFLNIRIIAQTSIAHASATIIQPIKLLQVRDMSFGKISPGETAGTVTLSPTEASIRTTSGGVSLSTGSGTVHSAKFNVTGADGYTYSIILPSTANIVSNGTSFMTIDNFTSTGSGAFSSGSLSICIGATLNVNANQEAGVYESTEDFEVTVGYN
ncbi:MAG TPA: DUF4402 domain-containing protein [Bacteroidales bacterium]|nr:DUF4402 domain-containing protein [Bacteroidales bacterium]